MKSQTALAEAAGVSPRTVARLEAGQRVGETSETLIEAALSWGTGSIDAIYSGGQPTPAERLELEPEQPSREEQLRELKTMAAALREYANELEERLNALSQEGDEQQAV